MKQEKGITLIALVITIIVLLILAGVALAMIAGNDSAPQKAAQAKIENEIGGVKDAITLNAANLMTEFYEKKYVGTTDTSNAANALAYFNATGSSTKLFAGIDQTNVATCTYSNGTITVTSQKTVASGSTTIHFVVTGSVDTNGAISWTGSSWQ